MPIKWINQVGKTGKVRKVADISVCVGGKRIHQQLSGDEATPKNAEALEKRLKQQLFDEVKLGKKPAVPLAVALGRYIEEQVYGQMTGAPQKAADKTAQLVYRLTPWVKDKTIADVVEVSRTVTRDMLKEGRAPATINRYLNALRRTAHLSLTDWDYLDDALWEKIRDLPGEKSKMVRMSVKEVWDTIDALDYQEAKDLVTVSLLTGFRLGECERILDEDRWMGPPQAKRLVLGYKVDYENHAIIIPDQKNGIPQWHPLLEQAITPIKRSFPLQFSRSGLQKMMRRALNGIGRPDCSFHTIRKSTGSILLDLGVSLEKVSQILRHQTLEVTAKSYGFMSIQTKRDGLEKLETAFQRPVPRLTED